MGFLRKVHAAEGAERAIGDVVAMVTTGAEEPCDVDEAAVAVAPAFRVVTNVADDSTEYSIS